MDLIGPLPQTLHGYSYIVTLTDYFSKWAEAAPLRDKTAGSVAKFVYGVSLILLCAGRYCKYYIVIQTGYVSLWLSRCIDYGPGKGVC